MRQSACLDCLHITPHLDQAFCPACQSTNMTSNLYQVVLVHAKRIEKDYEKGSKEFREHRFESLKALAEDADRMADRRRMRKFLKENPEITSPQERRETLREKYRTNIKFDEYFAAAANAENWRTTNASAN